MSFSFVELWQVTGPVARTVILVLLGLSVASLAVGIERLWTLRRAGRLSEAFLALWQATKERPWGKAVDVEPGPADLSPASILLRSLGEILDGRLAEEATERAYDRTMRRVLLAQGKSLRRGLSLLATIGTTAPFIGLFGTVTGIVDAFQQMARSGQGGLATVSGGIAEALITTALGILVAIPALWLYNSITARLTALLTELECAAEELAVAHLAGETAARRIHTKETSAGRASRIASLPRPGGERG